MKKAGQCSVKIDRPAVKSTHAPKKSAQDKTEETTKKGSAAKAPSKNEAAKAVPTPKKMSKPDPWQRVIESLRDHPNNQPATIAALERHVTTLLGIDKEKVVKAVIASLQKEGVVVLKGEKIEYDLTARAA